MQLRPLSLSGLLILALISGCDRLGLPDAAKDAAAKEADARATGSACRHAGRAIEDCYALNPDASRSAIYAGWREMNDYMRDNKIDTVKPEIAPSTPPKPASTAEGGDTASASAEASSAKEKKSE